MRFVQIGQYSINLDQIIYVVWFEPQRGKGQLAAQVYFAGQNEYLSLQGEDAVRLGESIGYSRPQG